MKEKILEMHQMKEYSLAETVEFIQNSQMINKYCNEYKSDDVYHNYNQRKNYKVKNVHAQVKKCSFCGNNWHNSLKD